MATTEQTPHAPVDSATEPKVGDIVVYIGDVTSRSGAWRQRKESGTEFIVTRTPSYGVHCVEVAGRDDDEGRDSDWFFAAPSSVRVVRRASYTEVQ